MLCTLFIQIPSAVQQTPCPDIFMPGRTEENHRRWSNFHQSLFRPHSLQKKGREARISQDSHVSPLLQTIWCSNLYFRGSNFNFSCIFFSVVFCSPESVDRVFLNAPVSLCLSKAHPPGLLQPFPKPLQTPPKGSKAPEAAYPCLIEP